MNMKDFRIVFMGTPPFAVASLQAIVQAGCKVVAVVTAPDKPAGRGMQLQESAVKKYAIENQIPVLQPLKLKDKAFLEELQAYNADLQVVVAFRMLPEVVWNMPPMGTINVHGSLLPQYRGAAPINWAVINGETSTGVTTFKLKHAIDTGNILLQATMPIEPQDTAGDVHDKMMYLGAKTLVATLEQMAAGVIKEQPQTASAHLRHAPKIFTETCKLDFTQSVEHVHNLVRGLSPFPGAFTMLNNKTCKIYRSAIELGNTHSLIGAVDTDGKTFLRFGCANGWLHVKELQLEGKKKMKVDEFLRGYRMPE
jgi:methionyl-tRNA formyltransferase